MSKEDLQLQHGSKSDFVESECALKIINLKSMPKTRINISIRD